MAKSGFFKDSRAGAQAAVKVMAGMELGIGPVAAMTGIHIVKDKVTLGANLIAGQVKRSNVYDYRVVQLDNAACVIDFFAHGEKIGSSSFRKEDAQTAGLWGSQGPWRNTPRNMLFARAISNGAKWFCPDVFAGPVYTPEELGAVVDEDGEIIEIPSAPRQPAPPAPPSDPVADSRMQELVALAGDPKTVATILRSNGFANRADLADDARWQEAKALVAAAANPVEPAEATGEVISEDQRRYLEALARDLGRDHDWMSALAAEAGFSSSTLITKDQFDAFKDAMARQAEAEDKATRQEAA